VDKETERTAAVSSVYKVSSGMVPPPGVE